MNRAIFLACLAGLLSGCGGPPGDISSRPDLYNSDNLRDAKEAYEGCLADWPATSSACNDLRKQYEKIKAGMETPKPTGQG